MNNKDFIAEIAQRMDYTQSDVQRLVDATVNEMAKNLTEGNAIFVPGFGTFDVKKRMERIMVNPSTGKRMLVPPKLVVSFKPVASIKELLKNGGEEDE